MGTDNAAGQGGDDDRRARRNALVLSLAQALYFVNAAVLVTVSGLVGHMLADDKSLATLPVTTFILGTLISTIPASLLMRRIGRRTGFQIGTLFALASASLATYAIFEKSFWLYCGATVLAGVYQATSQYYRFAAADTASESFRPKAISWVMAGGLVAAVAGPQLVVLTKDMFAPVIYAGSFVASAVAAVLAMLVLCLVDIPRLGRGAVEGEGQRSLGEILAQPKLRVAILTGMVSYGSMNFIMTATPLAMIACNHSVESAAQAIQWHLFAMFAPSFVTGHLINRFGREAIVLTGMLLLASSGLIATTGLALWQFNLAMVLLGLGWNFGYIGSTTMVTDCHRPEERNKVQAINEFMVFGLVAVASFSSGKVLHVAGWNMVTMAYLPFVALAAGLVLLLLVRGAKWGVEGVRS